MHGEDFERAMHYGADGIIFSHSTTSGLKNFPQSFALVSWGSGNEGEYQEGRSQVLPFDFEKLYENGAPLLLEKASLLEIAESFFKSLKDFEDFAIRRALRKW